MKILIFHQESEYGYEHMGHYIRLTDANLVEEEKLYLIWLQTKNRPYGSYRTFPEWLIGKGIIQELTGEEKIEEFYLS